MSSRKFKPLKRAAFAVMAALALVSATGCDIPDRTTAPLKASTLLPREKGNYGPAASERYELHTPANWSRTNRRTAVLYVHGGAWVAGTPGDVDPLAASLTRNGHVVISVGYELGTPVTSQVSQLKRAVQWVAANPNRLGIDPNKIFVAGHSAGGHLATMLGITWGVGNPIKGAIAIAPPLNLADPTHDPYIYGIRVHSAVSSSNRCPGIPCPSDVLAAISPSTHVDPTDPPLYLVIGELDPYAPLRHARELEQAYARVFSNNDRVWVDVVEGGDHQPGTRANSEYVEHFLKLYGG